LIVAASAARQCNLNCSSGLVYAAYLQDEVIALMYGDLCTEPLVYGDLCTEPLVYGDLCTEPLVYGDLCTEPLVYGDLCTEPLVYGDLCNEPLEGGLDTVLIVHCGDTCCVLVSVRSHQHS
jgi:hypothetical protein